MIAEQNLRAVFEGAPIGVIVVDLAGLIVEVNSIASEMFLRDRSELVGSTVDLLVPERLRSEHELEREAFHSSPVARRMGTGRDLTALRSDGSEFPVEIGLGTAEVSGRKVILCFIADITVRQKLIEENRNLISNLERALEEVRQLSGLLPICAACKRIRDKSGDWYELEKFIEGHSEAEFSHGICPECARRLYPQYFPSSE